MINEKKKNQKKKNLEKKKKLRGLVVFVINKKKKLEGWSSL